MIGNLSGGIHLPPCHLVTVIFSLKSKTKRSLDDGNAECQGRAQSNYAFFCFLCLNFASYVPSFTAAWNYH